MKLTKGHTLGRPYAHPRTMPVHTTFRTWTKRTLVQRRLAGDYEVATAISRKIDNFQITYPAASLILLADAIHKKKKSHVLRALERHKKNLPNIFEKIAEFWGFIIKNEKLLFPLL